MKKRDQIERRGIVFFVLLLICCFVVSTATAEWTITAEMVKTYKKESHDFTYFLESSTVLITREGKGYVLRDIDDNILSKEYDSFDCVTTDPEYPVLGVKKDGKWGAINSQGFELAACQYSSIKVLSDKWIGGVLNKKATENEAYIDIWYMGKLITCLTHDEYRLANAYGDYLQVLRREKGNNTNYFWITPNGDRRDAPYDEQFIGKYGNIVHAATGQPAFVQGCSLNADSILPEIWCVSNNMFSDVYGNIFTIPVVRYGFPDVAIDVNNGYFIVEEDEAKKKGIYTITGKEILPCIYDKIGYSTRRCLFTSGYQAVVKDGKAGYVDIHGNETSGFQIAYTDNLGGFGWNCPFSWTADLLTGKSLIISAACGVLPKEYDSIVTSNSPYSFVLGVKNNGLCGVIDLYGNEIIPIQYKELDISYDGSIVVGTHAEKTSTYDVYKIICSQTESNAEMNDFMRTEDASTIESDNQFWVCPNCGKEDNTGNYCSNCATPRPTQSWTCPNCGREGNTDNYCPNCAAPRP